MESGFYNWDLHFHCDSRPSICCLDWLADSSTAQGLGVSASSLFSWSFVRYELQNESPEECSTAEAADCVSWGRIRLSLDADKFMSWTEVQHPTCSKSGSKARTNACGTEVVCLDCKSDCKQFGRVEVDLLYLLQANQFSVLVGSLCCLQHLCE